jgi:glycosyltransferase involved in cell wall biosynthesis
MAPRKQKLPRVSIVIRAFNEEKHIGRLLAAIRKQTLHNPEIILVDSGSTDRTVAIARPYHVRVVHIKPKDFTFGRSLNVGIAAAHGDVLVLASAHVLPMHNDWLANLVAPFRDAKVTLAYGKQRGTKDSKFSEAQHWLRWYPERSNFDQTHGYCNNANAAIRRRVWKQNPFDEDLTGLEDLAWGSWVREAGYKIAYVANAGVLHLHDENAAQILNRHRREAIAMKQILPASRFTLWNFLSLFLRRSLSDLAAALRARVFLREALGIISFRFLQYLGTYRGYRDPAKPSQKLRQVFYYPPDLLEPGRNSKPDQATYKEAAVDQSHGR